MKDITKEIANMNLTDQLCLEIKTLNKYGKHSDSSSTLDMSKILNGSMFEQVVEIGSKCNNDSLIRKQVKKRNVEESMHEY